MKYPDKTAEQLNQELAELQDEYDAVLAEVKSLRTIIEGIVCSRVVLTNKPPYEYTCLEYREAYPRDGKFARELCPVCRAKQEMRNVSSSSQ
jgi:ABC-type Zn uptake system ZnuABC Zn-binding protein ZnuA